MLPMTRREMLAGLGCLAGASILGGCAVNPVTGKRELMLMSEAQEISMGREAHGQIVLGYGSYGDESLQEWFDGKGKEMAAVTHRKHLPWHFTVLDSPVINAFAVPGGYVYVTRGILGYFNDEAQFAGVLGHELGHVNARHTAARYSKAQLANLGLILGSILSEEFARYADFASLGTTLLFLKFSRNDEREADRLGVLYSSTVGYDAVRMSDFFKTLERLRPAAGSLPTWQSTHPDPGDRIKATRKLALQYQREHPGMKFRVNRDEYLDRIDGIVFGDDPRQGYVEDGVFYHPTMKFQFPAPKGWRLTNQPTEVRMSPEDQGALLIFTLAPGSDPRSASVQFARQNNLTIEFTSIITVNGMPGIKMVGEMAGGAQVLGISSYFIGLGEHVYAFHGLSDPRRLATYDAVFGASATGFSPLTDESKSNVSPKRLEIRRTGAKTTLKDALNAFGVPGEELERFAVINGMELADEIEPGTRLKVVS